MTVQVKYKSPVFAVFPFEQPDIFQYAKPNYELCDQFLLKSIKQLEEDQAKGVGKKKVKKEKTTKKKTKTSKK
ncbi:Conserved_hypothetical protein [Hexamita inflata]|uniref:Uncharacterized protein n=1 Tax=Hexamita inflata TaxID=28002 RepID=A0AA86V3P5_9EUKA|nr:Conserved hypothetical protein [Hexamita inflata]CAI9975012.1 Conserved hypothetical protein [Hexamita inflata]CAI9976064.1 Conserved hypothetical protein [Hexamita inflata]